MPRLDEVYLSRSEVQEMDGEFYRSYEEGHWKMKIGMYDYLLENMEDAFENQDKEFYEDCRRQVKAEFVYLFYHSTEALLGLVRSLSKGGIPWVDLKETRGWKIDEFVDEDLQEDAFKDELRGVFYPATNPTKEQEKLIGESVELIWQYLKYIGRMYGKRTVYNEYKHGLRLVARQSKVEMRIDDDNVDKSFLAALDGVEETEDGLVWNALSGDVLFYLDSTVWARDEDTGKKYWSLSRKMRSLEYELFRRLCQFNADLITQIFSVRRDILDIDRGDRAMSEVTFWDDIDLQEFVKPENSMQSFSVSVYHPRSEEDILEYKVK